MSKIPTQIEKANQHHGKALVRIGILLFAFGLLLPYEWIRILGTLSEPILWVATHIPAVEKAAAASPVRELVQGFFGTAFLLLPVLFTIVLWGEPAGLRFKYVLDQEKSKLKFFSFNYLLLTPMTVLMLYLIFFLPGEIHLGAPATRGRAIFSLMTSYRFSLALFGSFLTVSVIALLWLLTHFMAGPFFYFIERLNHRGN